LQTTCQFYSYEGIRVIYGKVEGIGETGMNHDLRDSAEDGSQRMLNAIEPGSELPIHRHQKTSETMVCLRGKLRVEYYDELEWICTDSFVIEPGGENVAVSIPIGVWHTVHALESGTCILEMKNGSYEPLSDEDILK
jgi:cupin fold WbuC family metalloprotein